MLVSSELPLRQRKRERWSALKMERESRLSHWIDIQSYLIPYAGSFLSDPRGYSYDHDRWQEIIDEWGPNAVETLEAGMMALRTNPSRRWFRYLTRDPDLNTYGPVLKWFRKAEERTQTLHRDTNTNEMLPHLYGECATFGTAGAIMTEAPGRIMHHHTLTAGEYAIACDQYGDVDTLYREFRLTVAQMFEMFPQERLSVTVKALASDHRWDAKVPVIHAIEPRRLEERDPKAIDALNMPWKSVYFELEDGDAGDRFLSESGFTSFPCLVPRWRVRFGSTWGEGPGTKALGSVRELQVVSERLGEVEDYQTKPPVQGPASLREHDRDLLPGGYIPFDQNSPHGGVRTAFEVKLDPRVLLEHKEDVRRRIDKSFYVHLFQPITMLSDTTQRTAQEIIQRRAEILTVLSPIEIPMQRALDRPLIQYSFERLLAEGELEPPPPELDGQLVDVEFMGPLAQALKETDAGNVDRMVAHIGQLAVLKPDVIDRYDADNDLERYADMLGVDPHLIVPAQQAAFIRAQRAKAQAAAAQAQMMASAAGTAKDLAAADMSGQNALTAAGGGME